MIPNKLKNNIFYNINLINERISHLEKQLMYLSENLEEIVAIDRSHMIRVKNGEAVSNDTIFNGSPYNDLSPDKAWLTYKNKNINFILVDVSHEDSEPSFHFEEAIRISIDDIESKAHELLNKKVPILIISEDGCRSVLACEKLAELGYYNTNNISGGYKFWPGQFVEETSKAS